MAVDFVHSSLPPCLSKSMLYLTLCVYVCDVISLIDEKKCTIYNRGPSLEEDGKVAHQAMITLDTMIKIIRQKSVR